MLVLSVCDLTLLSNHFDRIVTLHIEWISNDHLQYRLVYKSLRNSYSIHGRFILTLF